MNAFFSLFPACGQYKSTAISAFYNHSIVGDAFNDSSILLVAFVSLEFMVVHSFVCIFCTSYTRCNTTWIYALAIWNDKTASISILYWLHHCDTICVSQMALFYNKYNVKSVTASFNGRHFDDIRLCVSRHTHTHHQKCACFCLIQ